MHSIAAPISRNFAAPALLLLPGDSQMLLRHDLTLKNMCTGKDGILLMMCRAPRKGLRYCFANAKSKTSPSMGFVVSLLAILAMIVWAAKQWATARRATQPKAAPFTGANILLELCPWRMHIENPNRKKHCASTGLVLSSCPPSDLRSRT